MNGDYLHHCKSVLEGEFARIEMKTNIINISINMEQHVAQIQTMGSMVAQHYPGSWGASMEVTFYCNQTQYEELAPFIERAERDDIAIYPDVGWSTQQTFASPFSDPRNKIEQECRYKCTMTLYLTGGSMKSFISSFREVTDKLFYEIESKKFDDEVVDTLSEE